MCIGAIFLPDTNPRWRRLASLVVLAVSRCMLTQNSIAENANTRNRAPLLMNFLIGWKGAVKKVNDFLFTDNCSVDQYLLALFTVVTLKDISERYSISLIKVYRLCRRA